METIRKFDELGRIVLPPEMRNALGWHNNSNISITLQEGHLILRAFRDSCFACGNEEHIKSIHGKFICQTCIDEITHKK